MGTEIDYGAVLADLEAKRTAIDAAIAGVRQMLNLGAEQSSAAPLTLGRQEQATQVRFDSFFRMPMPAAITKFLEIAKSPQSVSDVTTALLNGGFKTTSKNLMPSVGSTLSRMRASGVLVNVDGKWGMSSWYSAARKPEMTEKPRKTRKRGRRKGTKTDSALESERTSGSPYIGTPKLTPEQVEQIKARSAAGESRTKLAKEFGVSRSSVWGIVTGRTWKSATANEASETEDGPKLHAVS